MSFLAKVIAVGQASPETFLDLLRLNELRSLSLTIHQLFFAAEMVSKFPLSNPAPLILSDTEVINSHRTFDASMSSLREYLLLPVKAELPARLDQAKTLCLTLCRFLQSRLDYLAPKIKHGPQNGCLPETLPSFKDLSLTIEKVMAGVRDQSLSEEMVTSFTETLSLFKNSESFDSLSLGVGRTDKVHLKRMIYEAPQSFVNGLAVLGGLPAEQLDLVTLIAAISVAADRPLLEVLPKFVDHYCESVSHNIGLNTSQLTQLKFLLEGKILGQVLPGESAIFDELISQIPDGHDAYFIFKGIELLAFSLHQVRQASMGGFAEFLKICPEIKEDSRFDLPEPRSLTDSRDVAIALQQIGESFTNFVVHEQRYKAPFTRMTELSAAIQKNDLNAIFEFIYQAPLVIGESDLETQFYTHLTRIIREKVPAYLFCLESPLEAMTLIKDKLAYYFEKTEGIFGDSPPEAWEKAHQFFSEGKLIECLESLGPFISRNELRCVEPMTTIYDIYGLMHFLKSLVTEEVSTWGSGLSAAKRWVGMSSERPFFETWKESIEIRKTHLEEVTHRLDEIKQSLGEERYLKVLRLSKEIVAIKAMEYQIASKDPHTLSYEDLAQLISALKDDSFLHAKKGVRLDDISKIDDVLELILYFDMVGSDHVIEALEGEKQCRIQSVDRYRDQFFKDTELQRSGSMLNSTAYRFAQACRLGIRGNFGLLYASSAGRMGAHLLSSNPQTRGNIDTAITLGAATLSVALFSPSWIPIVAGMASANFTPSDYLSEALRNYQYHRSARVVDWVGAPVTSMLTSGTMSFLDYGSWEMAYNSAVRTPFYLGSMHIANTALERSLGYLDSQTGRYLGLMAGSLGAGYLASQHVDDLPGMAHLQTTLPEWVILADQQRLAFEKNNCRELGFSYSNIWFAREFFKDSNKQQYLALAKVKHPDAVRRAGGVVDEALFPRLGACKESTT